MSQEIVNQATEFFKDKDQWYSFLQLCVSKNEIRNAWYSKLKEKMNEKNANNSLEKWRYHSWGIWDYRWYLSELGHESLCIWVREYYNCLSVTLWANRHHYEIKKVSQLLSTQKYLPIVSCFERFDDINDENNDCKIVERGNFVFNDPDDGHINMDKLAWYANFETDKLVDQIMKKVDRFRKDEKVTSLLEEINQETKIN